MALWRAAAPLIGPPAGNYSYFYVSATSLSPTGKFLAVLRVHARLGGYFGALGRYLFRRDLPPFLSGSTQLGNHLHAPCHFPCKHRFEIRHSSTLIFGLVTRSSCRSPASNSGQGSLAIFASSKSNLASACMLSMARHPPAPTNSCSSRAPSRLYPCHRHILPLPPFLLRPPVTAFDESPFHHLFTIMRYDIMYPYRSMP